MRNTSPWAVAIAAKHYGVSKAAIHNKLRGINTEGPHPVRAPIGVLEVACDCGGKVQANSEDRISCCGYCGERWVFDRKVKK